MKLLEARSLAKRWAVPSASSMLVWLAAPLASGAIALALAPASAADDTATAAARTASCPDVQVVFARGTGEPSGPGRVGDAFVDSLRSLVGAKSVAVYAVDYPASRDFLRAVDGANDARAFIQNVATSCPSTKLVLGGYSQGAAVIDIITVAGQPTFGFADPLPDSVAEHVAAVAVFGNPSNRVGGPLTALSPAYGSKTIDLCNGADPVCSDGSDIPAHSLYVQAGMTTQAAQFVTGRLAAESTTHLAATTN
jgi:cutinase